MENAIVGGGGSSGGGAAAPQFEPLGQMLDGDSEISSGGGSGGRRRRRRASDEMVRGARLFVASR
eukprot:COSAG06_NODE_288_length_18224_cov_8.849948_4_plen_65_part_00